MTKSYEQLTQERVRELLAAATPAPWRMGRRDLDHEDSIPQYIPTRNIPLLLAAPEIAQAYIDKCDEIENLWREIADGTVHP